MIVKPTDKWLYSIAVPNCGIVRRPFTSDVADVSDTVGKWLIEAGFAVAKKEGAIEQPQASTISEPSQLPEKPIESFKPKKTSKSFVEPGET